MGEATEAQLGHPPLLRWGFRPFFLLGSGWAVTVLGLWLAVLAGAVDLPSALDPLTWHRHEMLFGFPSAVIAGFLLTAVPNWTGRPPLFGKPLLALVLWWILARLAVLSSAATGWLPAIVLDTGFYLLLVGHVLRQLLLSGNRNYPVAAICALLGCTSGLDLAQGFGCPAGFDGWKAGLSLVLLLIALIGGRIIPAFTRNWLTKQGRTHSLPAAFGRIDGAAIGALGLALLLWVAAAPGAITAAALLTAAAMQIARLARWRGMATVSDPLVFILHLSYAWLPLGLALLAASEAGLPVPQSSAIHALGAGATGSMILAVMTRASLGHTGRALVAGAGLRTIYLLVTVGALARVIAPLTPFGFASALQLAGLIWGGAFLLFVALFAPILAGPRPDGKA